MSDGLGDAYPREPGRWEGINSRKFHVLKALLFSSALGAGAIIRILNYRK